MPLLSIRDITLRYQGQIILKDVDLGLDQDEILGLLGPSGCGKTTLLRVIAGLETPDNGSVFFQDRNLDGVPPHVRKFGMMFQEFALFPHRNVFENVAFGLRMQKRPKGEIAALVGEMMDLVGLAGKGERNVEQLSGGERQRVALARCLCPRPKVILLDEPLGALDRRLRDRLMLDIRRILKRLGVSAVFVTHDQAEAFAVADKLAVLDQGRLQQVGRPQDVYHNPASLAVAQFLGFSNLIPGVVADNGIETDDGLFPAPGDAGRPGNRATLVIRPDGATLSNGDEDAPSPAAELSGTVTDLLFQGRTYYLGLRTASNRQLFFDLPPLPMPPPVGSPVRLSLGPDAFIVYPEGHSDPEA
jgi:ABC-type Fe3+/spermidine/putrescine transport system ATPase subunit